MRNFLRNQKHNVIFACVFVLFTVFTLLYVFVIPRKSKSAPIESEKTFFFATAVPVINSETATPGNFTKTPASADPEITPEPTPAATPEPTAPPTPTPTPSKFTNGEVQSGEDYYIDANINIKITTYRYLDTDVHVAEIYLRTAEYFRTAFAKDTFGRNYKEYTSKIAKDNDAVFAVNGDYYGARNKGYVIRNGKLYRNSSAGRDCLAVMTDGSMKIVKENRISAKELLDQGCWQAFTFGPGLVADGALAVDEDDEVGAHLESNPRTAVGMIEPLHYLFVVSDGRTRDNAGLSLYELAGFLLEQGAVQAYNLDGGGSSTMYFMGYIINQPTSTGKTIGERSVSDIVYIG